MGKRCGGSQEAKWRSLEIYMAEASNYYVTVSVDHCIIPGGVMIRAASKALQLKELK
jgi:hypothetical protein